jgi:hypothetical protein
MQKIKNWLLALSAFSLGVLALYIKFLKKAATKAKLKSLQEKELELRNEISKHNARAVNSLLRARKLRDRMRGVEKDLSGDE